MLKTEKILNINTCLLAIESSCDDTSCAVLKGTRVLSNVTANQKIHEQYGGVVPELASRDHQKNIVPVVEAALKAAGVTLQDIEAVAVTRGPGLMGSLLVGLNFAKSLSLALQIPLIEVDHMQAHILAHFAEDGPDGQPEFPYLCLTVSGGHTQLVNVKSPMSFEILGQTIDDAVGEAFDKAAKILGLPYPGGPYIDKLAGEGDEHRFTFSDARIPGFDFSFSGVKTSFLYFVNKGLKEDPDFIKHHLPDICASYQSHLINLLLRKTEEALKHTGIRHLAIAGGVSANSKLRQRVRELGEKTGVKTYIPKFEYCTDNAAMIGLAGHFRHQAGVFANLNITPLTRQSHL